MCYYMNEIYLAASEERIDISSKNSNRLGICAIVTKIQVIPNVI